MIKIENNRIFIIKILTSNDVVSSIKKELNKILLVIPELKDIVNFEHCHPHHHLNVWEHTLIALEFSDNNLNTRLALLLHDIGKPHSYQEDGEIRHYMGHPQKSAEISRRILERLGFDKDIIWHICEIVRRHDMPLRKSDIINRPALSKSIFEVQKCDAMAHNPIHNAKRMAYINEIEEILSAFKLN